MDKKTEFFILCENIKRLRKKENLSKSKMAEKLGISVRSLTLIERGIIPPRLSCEFLFEIHRHFGITPQNIFSIIISIEDDKM